MRGRETSKRLEEIKYGEVISRVPNHIAKSKETRTREKVATNENPIRPTVDEDTRTELHIQRRDTTNNYLQRTLKCEQSLFIFRSTWQTAWARISEALFASIKRMALLRPAKFRGLLEDAKSTTDRSDLKYATIKVKRDSTKFYTIEVIVPCWGREAYIRIRSTEQPEVMPSLIHDHDEANVEHRGIETSIQHPDLT
ncbi:hypothetical protein Syun_009413 [Stephania yunnanensis]|uniref:Uncharacterized protein n=1 Tax=Stephania yunnanensis TaxID=152371 RepID=A0AAP0PQM4_9MAGN